MLEGTVIRLREQLLNDGFNSADIEQMMQENFDEEDYPLQVQWNLSTLPDLKSIVTIYAKERLQAFTEIDPKVLETMYPYIDVDKSLDGIYNVVHDLIPDEMFEDQDNSGMT